MAVNSVNTVATAPSAVDAASALNTDNLKSSSDRFLKLLVAQMQNQDPLNPMDNAQVTSQMAQINTVSGIEKLNGTVASLSGQFAQLQALQGASLVGRDVIVPGNRLDIVEGGLGQGGFELEGPADKVKVEILSGSGSVLDTLDLGAQSGGVHSFDWPSGTHAADAGLKFRVTATSGGASKVVTPLMRDTVDAVTTSGTGFSLELAHTGSTAYGAVKAFN